MTIVLGLVIVVMLLMAGLLVREVRARNMQIWLWNYLRRRRLPEPSSPVHVMFCFVDHYEPMWGGADPARQRARVDRWCRDYRALAGRHRDADGRPPQHSFFYPEEEYAEEHLEKIAALCSEGYGELEIHLHHDNDTEENFRRCIARFCRILTRSFV